MSDPEIFTATRRGPRVLARVVTKIDVTLAQDAHFLRQALELEIARSLALDHSDQLVGQLKLTITRNGSQGMVSEL